MPKFLEQKLRTEYGNNAHAIYGTMNEIGAMRGNKEAAKGREMEKEHEAHMKKVAKAEPIREMRIEIHRGPKKEVTGFTVHHHMMPKPSSKSQAFYEDTHVSHPFSADEHGAMMAHVNQHMKGQVGSVAAGGGEPDGDEGEEA